MLTDYFTEAHAPLEKGGRAITQSCMCVFRNVLLMYCSDWELVSVFHVCFMALLQWPVEVILAQSYRLLT